jgi:hypothetical protein
MLASTQETLLIKKINNIFIQPTTSSSFKLQQDYEGKLQQASKRKLLQAFEGDM